MPYQKRKRSYPKRPSKRFKRLTRLGILLLFVIALLPWAHDFWQNRAKTPVGSHLPATLISPSLSYDIAAGGSLTSLDEQDLNTYMQNVTSSGAKWIRFDVDWSQIQPNNSSSYNWAPTDRVMRAASGHGLKVLALLSYTPRWARSNSCSTSSDCPPNNPSQFATFAQEAVKRYGAQDVSSWEVWNEPNNHQFWQSGVDPAEYVSLLKATYKAIKAHDPAATVLSGGLAAVGDDSGDMSPITFVKAMYMDGASGYFDAVAVHPYSFPALPSYVATWNRWQQIVPIHNEMVSNGDANKKIWITEFGSPTNGPGAPHSTNQVDNFTYQVDYMTEVAQQQELSNALELYKSYSPWIGPFFYYTLQDSSTDHNSTDSSYGLLRVDGTKKPAYYTWQETAQAPQ